MSGNDPLRTLGCGSKSASMKPDPNRDGTAAGQSADFAQYDMASMLEWITGNGQEHRAYRAMERGDFEAARRLLEPVADRGSEYSLLTLGGFYEWGKLGPPDTNMAISYYERAATQGSAEAYRRLGRLLYDLGEEERARAAFEHGAEADNISCMYWLGRMMVEGRGGGPEVTRGTEWLIAAAAQGQVLARRDLLVLGRKQADSIMKKLFKQLQFVYFLKDVVKEVLKDPDSDKIR